MRAAVLRSVGDQRLELRHDVSTVDLDAGQIRVGVRATSLCHSDLSVMNGTLGLDGPIVLGHEAAGVVTELGSNVSSFALGDRIIVRWKASCGACMLCTSGRDNLCTAIASQGQESFVVDGARIPGFMNCGTFAEEIIVDQRRGYRLPDDVPFEFGALIGCAVTTGVGAAVNTAAIKPGESVAVIGLGAVGMAAIQGAALCDAGFIAAVDPIKFRRDLAQSFGASEAAEPSRLAAMASGVNGGLGFDHVIEAVGRPETVRAGYDAARRGGTITVVGVGSAADQAPVSLYELLGEKRLQGSYYGGGDVSATFDLVVEAWRAGRLDLGRLITDRGRLDDINHAIELMSSGSSLRTTLIND